MNLLNGRILLIGSCIYRFRQKSTSEWLELLESSNIPYGPINNMEQVFDDPQVKEITLHV